MFVADASIPSPPLPNPISLERQTPQYSAKSHFTALKASGRRGCDAGQEAVSAAKTTRRIRCALSSPYVGTTSTPTCLAQSVWHCGRIAEYHTASKVPLQVRRPHDAAGPFDLHFWGSCLATITVKRPKHV